MTPEWHRQDAVLLAWPDENTDWKDNLAEIQATYREIILAITTHEKVVLLIHDNNLCNEIVQFLNESGIDPTKIVFSAMEYDDTWLRDSGPVNILLGDYYPGYIDYRFNGWGNKFSAEQDDRICQQLFTDDRFQQQKIYQSDIILEGGSIETNGQGVLLTTDSCLLSSTRNPQTTRKDYEDHFKEFLGIQETIWLEHGKLAGDDTDGHIDMLARFCNENTIVYTSCDKPEDEHFSALKNMEQELVNKAGSFKLIPLPIPDAIVNHVDQRLPASYVNFLIINNAVLVPVYDDPNDEIACERLAEVFTDRTIIPINARSIIQQGGSLHCLTMQLNEGLLNQVK